MARPIKDAYARYSDVVENYGFEELGPKLRAEDNMNYREFIAVLKNLWEGAHPEIPIVPEQAGAFATYPVIVYSLELRKAHPAEPKERFREKLVDDIGNIYSIYGQRFQNLVKFSIITRSDPDLATAIVEEFQKFMEEYTGVLKRLGTSEVIFSRRMPDKVHKRSSEDVNENTIIYLVTLENVRYEQESELTVIVNNVRLILNAERVPGFEVTAAQVGGNTINILRNNLVLRENDIVILGDINNIKYQFPGGILSDIQYHLKFITYDNSATPSIMTAQVYKTDSVTPVTFSTSGKGTLRHTVSDNISSTIEDQYSSATPSI